MPKDPPATDTPAPPSGPDEAPPATGTDNPPAPSAEPAPAETPGKPAPLPTTPPIEPAGPVPQTQLKPIARWSIVPNQRINPGETFNVGVVAFSKYGISHVRFIISGQGYSGPASVDVTEMTFNEQTGLYEYWTPIAASSFASNGVITVEAEVYGHDGGLRNKDTDGGGLGLDPLALVVNPTGSLQQVQAWVSPGGNDSSGVANNPAQPFGTIGRAMDAIRAYRAGNGMGNNADGGIVRLMPGDHHCSTGGVGGTIACNNEWLTITTAEGATRMNTTILPGSIVPTRKLRVRGLTVSGGGNLGMSYNDRMQGQLWIDRCALVGNGRTSPGAHPLSAEYGKLYYTDSSITQVQQATSGSTMCRGLDIRCIADDAFQNVPLVLNCVVDDIDPGSSGAHADAWQHGMGNAENHNDDNVIVYNLVATGLKYQSLFIRGDIYSPPTMAQGMAFVNVYMDMLPDSHGWAGWGRWTDHLLWWHCTFAGKGMGFMSDTYAGGPKQACRVRNFSVKGCHFAFFGDGGADINWSAFESNHFVDGSVTEGSDATTGGDGLDGSGVPQNGSPLIGRMAPVVPVDAGNRIRKAPTSVGAYEH